MRTTVNIHTFYDTSCTRIIPRTCRKPPILLILDSHCGVSSSVWEQWCANASPLPITTSTSAVPISLGNHLPIAVVFVMLVFILSINVLLKKLKPGTELQGGELLIIWGMMIVASGIPSSGLMRYLVPLAVSPHYFATAENEWITLFHQHLPDWMVVKDPKAVFYFYEQLPDGDSIPWRAWLKPIVGWSAFVLIFYFVTICWTVLLRKQWVEHERFTFPIVQLPQEMFQPPSGGTLLNQVLQITG